MREYRTANPEWARDQDRLSNAKKKQRRTERREALNQRFKQGPCMDCGGTFPPEAMDFDHTSDDKIDGVSEMIKQGRPLAVIEAEIEKCDLVCANCHRIRTHTRRV